MGSAGASIRRGSLRPRQTESRCTKTQLDVAASRTWKTSQLSQVLRVDTCSTCRASAWAVSCIGALPAAPTRESAATHSLSWSGRPLAHRADGYSDWRRGRTSSTIRRRCENCRRPGYRVADELRARGVAWETNFLIGRRTAQFGAAMGAAVLGIGLLVGGAAELVVLRAAE